MIKYAYILAFAAIVMITLSMSETSKLHWQMADICSLSASVMLIASALIAQVNELRNTKQ